MKTSNKNMLVAVLAAVFCFAAIFSLFAGQSAVAAADELATEEAELLDENFAPNITEVNGLGLAINVITATSLTDFTTGYSVLDLNKPNMESLQCSGINLNDSIAASSSTGAATAVDIANSFGLSHNVGVSGQIKTFLLSVETGLNLNTNFTYSNYAYKYYFAFTQKVNKQRIWINSYRNPSTYANRFTSDFIAALAAIQNGEMTFAELFERYGTHIVGSAYTGGRLNAYYTLASNDIFFSTELGASLNTKVTIDKLDKNLKGTVSGFFHDEISSDYSEKSFVENFTVHAKGGSVPSSLSLSNFQSGYDAWCNSFNNSQNSVLVDYTADGLVPLWEILPAAYSSLASGMKQAFIQECNETEKSFLQKYKTMNDIRFEGSGTYNDPYTVKTPAQLRLIESTDMVAHYSLVADLDLSGFENWTPIGGYHAKNSFGGTFNGNGHTIKGLTRTADIEEKDNRSYFGLFGSVASLGRIEDLTLANVNISFAGPAVNNTNARVFVGVLAGKCRGTLRWITVSSGTVSYDCDTNGVAFIGGIVGLADKATIKFCTNKAAVSCTRYAAVAGGIAGYANGTTFSGCDNYGTVTTFGSHGGGAYSGAIVGERFYKTSNSNYKANTYTGCTNQGDILAEKNGLFGSKGTGINYGGDCSEYIS